MNIKLLTIMLIVLIVLNGVMVGVIGYKYAKNINAQPVVKLTTYEPQKIIYQEEEWKEVIK